MNAIGDCRKFADSLALPASDNYAANPLNQYIMSNGVTLPAIPAPYGEDGNLRFDGGVNKDNEAREYVWDGENRLIEVLNASGQSAVSLVTYAYDSQSRRISRTDETAGSTTWYIYDGWNVVSEYTGSTPALARTFTWGTDLSGTMQGAGGVGGLLAVRTGGVNYSVTYDGNGNVSEYLTEAGVVAAHFEYDPFGNLTGFTEQSQGLSASFAYRFSTKPVDEVTGLFYYTYRYYDPVTGRWPSRDPIEEEGGINLYGFVINSSIDRIDNLGLQIIAIIIPGPNEIDSSSGDTATLKLFTPSSFLESEIINSVSDATSEFESAIDELNALTTSQWNAGWTLEIEGEEKTVSLAEAKSLFRRELRSRGIVRYLTVSTFESFFQNSISGIETELDEDHDMYYYSIHAHNATFNMLSDGTIQSRSYISSLIPSSSKIRCLSCYQGDSQQQRGNVTKGEADIDTQSCTAKLTPFKLEAERF